MKLCALLLTAAGVFAQSYTTALNPQGSVRVYDPNTSTANFQVQNLYGFNLNPAYFTHFRAALAKVKYGGANAGMLCVGDSTTVGVGSNGTTYTGNLYAGNYCTVLASMLQQQGINTETNSWVGNSSGSAPSYSANDPRLTVGSSWNNCVADSVGGCMLSSTTTTNALTYTPTQPVNTFVISYLSGASYLGKFNWQIDGGPLTVVDTAPGGSAAISTTTAIAPALGLHTLKIMVDPTSPTGNYVFMIGTHAFDSTKSWVSVMNAGWSGSTSGQWNSGGYGYGPLDGIRTLAPDLTVISLGINDWNGLRTLADYKTNMQAIITTAQASGDVLLVTPPPSAISVQPQATQQGYVAVLYELAIANNIPLVDQFGRMVSNASATALGLEYDTLHPNGAGYIDMAAGVAQAINYMTGNGGSTVDTATPSVVSGTSGSASFSQPERAAFHKKVIVYCNGLAGSASYAFPAAFSFTPFATGPLAGIVTSLSATGITITGASSTGFLVIEGY